MLLVQAALVLVDSSKPTVVLVAWLEQVTPAAVEVVVPQALGLELAVTVPQAVLKVQSVLAAVVAVLVVGMLLRVMFQQVLALLAVRPTRHRLEL